MGNSADNLIPAKASATVNIRFNDEHSSDSLKAWIDKAVEPYRSNVSYRYRISGESFIYPPEAFGAMIADVVEDSEVTTGRRAGHQGHLPRRRIRSGRADHAQGR